MTAPQDFVPEALPPTTKFGGAPKPGYGVVPQESHFWETPIFKKHPLTGKLEASQMGLFFRLWPAHVKILQEMKLDDWYHTEIQKVAQELWKRQQDEYSKNEEVAQQHLDMEHENTKQDVAEMMQNHPDLQGGGEMEGEGEGEEEEGFSRGLSLSSEREYRERLEEFRGKFFNKDSGATMLKTQQASPDGFRVVLKSQNHGSLTRMGSVVLLKGEAGGERAPTIAELSRKRQQTFTRKEAGVLNSKTTSDPQLGATEEE